MRISEISLTDLYKRKITTSVEAAIQSKEDFSSIVPEYCEKVCRLKCKRPEGVQLAYGEVDILIVQDHEAPAGKYDRKEGQQEEIQQAIIFHLCRQAGFEGLRYRLVSLLKCSPTEEDFPKGKSPTITVISKCKPYLWAEIERCKPKVILSLSTAVTKALGYKKHSNTGNRGEYVDNVVITIHPRALTMIRQTSSGKFWGQELYGVILRDFKKAARMAKGELNPPTLDEAIEYYSKNRIRVAESFEEVKEFMSILWALPENTIVSVDTETTSLDPHIPTAKLLCIQFGYRELESGLTRALVIPLWHRTNSFFDPEEAWSLVAPWLESDRKKVMHNGKYDILYIWFTKHVRVRNTVFDTMLLLHSLDSGAQGTFSLKAAAWDIVPELGLGGYEDKLPKLTKVKKEAEVGDEEEVEDESA